MRLEKIQKYLTDRGIQYKYYEQEQLGSIDFEHRGVGYHIWEFEENGGYGAESNVKNGGKLEDYLDNYEKKIIDEMKKWE